jgi:acetyl-CoA C-acetyltransferase
MAIDPRTPVLVGAASASQRCDDPTEAMETVDLMAEACRRAADDAGSHSLLRLAEQVLVPHGSWAYHDAARLVADRIGANSARSLVFDLGILQTTMFERTASAIAAGDLDIAVIVGGETKWRNLRAAVTGAPAPQTDDSGARPDEFHSRQGHIISPAEIGAGLVSATGHYALIENARRAADGQNLAEHQREVAGLWARFNEVAQHNPDAWNRAAMSADDIRTAGPKNRPLAFPYNKWHNSQWNVDQAACLVMCSVEAARANGVPEDRWVFPHAIVESNHVVPVSERGRIHRSPGFAIAGAMATQLAGVHLGNIEHIDLYSCFPVAVRVQAAELGLDAGRRPLTVTGGMSFGGGPLNNYVLQSMAKMAHVLRNDTVADTGLVTAISGMITKQGIGIWSTRPPVDGYRSADVTAEAEAATPRVPCVAGVAGVATVATYTVLHAGDGPPRGFVVVDLDDGSRSIATSLDEALTGSMESEEWCGRSVVLDGNGSFGAA